MLSRPHQWRGLGLHPDKFKDGSPRNREIYQSPTQWTGVKVDFTSTSQSYFQPADGMRAVSPKSETREQRAERYKLAAQRRVSPAIYYNVYNREPGKTRELVDETMAMPQQAKVATRGAAATPTAGDWAEPSNPFTPRVYPGGEEAAAAAEEEYKRKLVRLKIASERRMRDAAMATAIAIGAETGNLSAR